MRLGAASAGATKNINMIVSKIYKQFLKIFKETAPD